jgi:hypothetical protein
VGNTYCERQVSKLNVASHEHIQSIPSIPDISKTGQAFSELLETKVTGELVEDPGLAVKRLPLPNWTLGVDDLNQDLTFMQVYNRLLGQNLVHLNRTVNNRMRIAKEKAARTAAAEIVLASAGIMLVDGIEPSTQDMNLSSQDNGGGKVSSSQSVPPIQGASETFALPWHPPSPRKVKAGAIEEAARHLDRGLPTPSVSRTASLASSSHLDSISHASFERGHAKRTFNAVKNRLSRYVEIGKPRTGRRARPIALLKHWGLGEDPYIYNFRQASKIIGNARLEAGMSRKERQSLWRAKEKHLQKQRRENERYKRIQEDLSSQVVVVPSSDPAFGESSSVAGAQSQGSTRKKKKKKKREGFN